MSRRISFTTVTPLPPSVSRQTAIAHLHDHLALIDLNPLVQSRHHLMSPPDHALASELRCTWYALADRLVPGLPGPVSYTAAFQNLPNGVQAHAYAPMGRDTKEWWTVGGSIPGEVPESLEPGLNVPRQGLYLRHDVEVRCNVLVAGFVKKTLRKTHTALMERIAAEVVGDPSKGQSPTSAFRSFADDETFLGPRRGPSSASTSCIAELPTRTPPSPPTSSPPSSASTSSIAELPTRTPSPPPASSPPSSVSTSSIAELPTRTPPPPPTSSPPPPPAFLRTPGPASTPTPPPAPTASPPPPPTFLQPAKGTPCLRLSSAPPFPRMLNPKATPSVPAGSSPYPPPLRIPNRRSSVLPVPSPVDSSPNALGSWSRNFLPAHFRSPKRHSSAISPASPADSSPAAASSWSSASLSPPIRNPKRHSTALSFPSPAGSSPDALGSWSRDSLPPRPQSTTLSRNTSVVSKYPHAAEQDYSDIAAMNPFDSDDEGSDSTIDSSLSDSAGGAGVGGFFAESPETLVVEPAIALPDLPGAIPRLNLRFEFDEAESGRGLGISVPGEMLEESYEMLEGRLPVLEDKRSSVRPPPTMQATLNGPVSYELY